VILAGLWVPDFAEHDIVGAPLLAASVIAASMLIAWHAWKWPVEPLVEVERQRVPLG
jgi:hypothetical protein